MTDKTVKNAVKKLGKTLNNLVAEAIGGLHAGKDIVFDKSQEIVPVIEGNLKASGEKTEEPIIANLRENWETVTTVEISYGGRRAPYAAEVHENPNSRGHKFLEKSINNNTENIKDAIVKGARTGVRRRV